MKIRDFTIRSIKKNDFWNESCIQKKDRLIYFLCRIWALKKLIKSNGNAGFKKHIRLIEKIFKNLCIF